MALFDDVLPPVLMADLLPSKAEFIEVRGATVSTVQLNDAGDGSLFPTPSWARATSVCTPSLRLSIWRGLVHVTNFKLSTLHSKWSSPTPVSLPENLNTTELDLVLLPLVIALLLPSIAALIVVVGGTVSTPQLNDAGVRFMFPTLSSALILKI